MTKQLLSFITIALLLLSGCQNKDTTEESLIETEEVADENLMEKSQESADEEIQEYGLLKAIEDGVYPMFILTIEFPERNMTADFNLNIEEISLDHTSLYELKDKYVTLYYLSEMENMLAYIQYEGKSLLGEYAPEMDPEWKTISGVLSGAESETMSDLPDEIIVTTNEGEKISFKEYITPEIVAANGKEVDVFYTIRGTETITKLVASDSD
ncbi:MAG: hypothetical protein HN600_17630 [Bacteroidetes bacterium]|nr:hypothetical protein [Bacteroidota bacterium]